MLSRHSLHRAARRLAGRLRRDAGRYDHAAREARRHLTRKRVHDLRILTRRMRAAAGLAGGLEDAGTFRRLRRLLRRTGRILGRRRTLDVAIRDYAELAGSRVPRSLRELHRESRAAVLGQLRRDRRMPIVREARNGAGRLEQASPGDARPVRRLLERRARRLIRAFEDTGRSRDQEALHLLRIEAKKTRYLLEILRRLGLHAAPEAERKLRRLQRLLGRARDFDILLTLVRTHPLKGKALQVMAHRRASRLRDLAMPVKGPAVREAVAALRRAQASA